MSDDFDPTNLGSIFEGDLYKTANGKWVIRDKKGEHAIEDILQEYHGEEVKLTIASFSDLEEIKRVMQQKGSE